ncbi:MAG: MFS transporter [Acidimicrobiia bacterium]|nr:MFS transporter [Acidimicrobiia bacterium]
MHSDTGVRRPPSWILFTISVVGVTLITPIAPVIPDILRALDAPESAAGLILGSATLPGILLAPVIGVLADRWGRRRVLLPCLVLFAAAGTLSILSTSVAMLATIRFFQGIGAAGLINLVIVLIGDHWDGTDRVRMLGRNSAALTAGIAALPTIGGALADWLGWRGPFYVYPLVFLVLLAAMRTLPKDQPTSATGVGAQLRASGKVLRTPVVLGLFGLEVVVMVAIFGLILTVLPFHLEEAYGLSAGARGLFLGAPSLVSFWISLNIARITQRFGRFRAITFGLVVFGASFFVLGSPVPLSVLVAGALLWGLAEGLTFPALLDRITEAAGTESRGTVIAVGAGAVRLGQTVGPLLGGVALVGVGAPTAFLAGAALLGGLAVVVVIGKFRFT